MAITITKGYTWANGNTVTPTRLNLALDGLSITCAADSLLGRSSGSGAIQEISCTAAGRALLDDNSVSDQRETLGLGADDVPEFSGIKFPAPQSPSDDVNALDDYEEGTWTPSLGGNATYSLRGGTYTKIGRQVHVIGRIVVSSIGTGSAGLITGLPFVSGSDAPVVVGYFQTIATAGYAWVGAYIPSGTATVQTSAAVDSATGVSSPAVVFTDGTDFIFSATYFV